MSAYRLEIAKMLERSGFKVIPGRKGFTVTLGLMRNSRQDNSNCLNLVNSLAITDSLRHPYI